MSEPKPLPRKPDISPLSTPALGDFIAGAGDVVLPAAVKRAKARAVKGKYFNLPVTVTNALRDEAHRRTVVSGVKVTEATIVEEALRTLLSMPIDTP